MVGGAHPTELVGGAEGGVEELGFGGLLAARGFLKGFVVAVAFFGGDELVGSVVEGVEGAVVDGLALGARKRGVESRRSKVQGRISPVFDAAEDLGDASDREIVVVGQLFLRAAVGVVIDVDGLVAVGYGTLFARQGAMVDGAGGVEVGCHG